MNTSQKQDDWKIEKDRHCDSCKDPNCWGMTFVCNHKEALVQNLQTIAQEIEQKFEHYEDKSDERYGFARMWNTMLSQLDDDIKLIVSNHIKELGE